MRSNGRKILYLAYLTGLSVFYSSVVLDCVCPTGYTGSLCETDLDACALVATPCYPGVLCQDQPAPAGLTGFE